MSSVPPIKIFLPILSFVYDFHFEGESSSTANTQEQLLELGARIDHVSEKMSGSLSCLKIYDEDEQEATWYPGEYQQWCDADVFFIMMHVSFRFMCTTPS